MSELKLSLFALNSVLMLIGTILISGLRLGGTMTASTLMAIVWDLGIAVSFIITLIMFHITQRTSPK